MRTHIVSLINAIILIVFGLWGFFGSENPSFTALIPVVFGVLLLVLNPGIKKENKIIAHIAVVFTLLVLIGLVMPLKGAISRDDVPAIMRVSVMLLASIAAMVAFVKSFVDARRRK